VYTIIKETSEDLDSAGNPLVNLANLKRGSKYVAPGTDKATIAASEKVQLTTATWMTIRATVNGMAVIPSDVSRKVLMGYQYALYLQGRHLEQVRQQIEEQRRAASASSLCSAELSNTSYSNAEGH
jgi:hypothetical protein